MKGLIKLVTAISLGSSFGLNSISCASCASSITYVDNRTPIQLQDAVYLLNNQLPLNPKKHVLLIGLDGLPFANINSAMISASKFQASYHIQNYETMKGWTSVLWGNILQKEKTIFDLVKNNNSNLTTANITQWMGSYYYNGIYGTETSQYFNYNYDFVAEADVNNYNTIDKMNHCLTEWQDVTNQKIDAEYNFIFSYNAFYDELKHQSFADNDALILSLTNSYKDYINNLYNTLNSSDWLIIVTTDHGRDSAHGNFNHPNSAPSVHFSWTLANNDLSAVLGHSYTNFYDIRTAALKWLMQS